MVPGGGIHAGPGINDGEFHVAAWRETVAAIGMIFTKLTVGGLDQQFSTRGHGVTRIHRQVHEDLAEVHGVGLHHPEGGIETNAELDILADDAAQHLVGSLHDMIEA